MQCSRSAFVGYMLTRSSNRSTNDHGVVVDDNGIGSPIATDVGEEGAVGAIVGAVGPVLVGIELAAVGPANGDRIIVDNDGIGAAVPVDIGEEGPSGAIVGSVGPVLVGMKPGGKLLWLAKITHKVRQLRFDSISVGPFSQHVRMAKRSKRGISGGAR